jgi:hypothetical protein
MTKTRIIINLQGGLVQDAFCSVPGVQVLVVDWDVEGSFPGEPGIVDVPLAVRKKTWKRGGGETRRAERAGRLMAEKWAESFGSGRTSFCHPCFCQTVWRGVLVQPLQGSSRDRQPRERCATLGYGLERLRRTRIGVGLGDPDLRGIAHDRCP